MFPIAVLGVRVVLAPICLRPFTFTDTFGHGQVGHEVVCGRPVPVPLVGWRGAKLRQRETAIPRLAPTCSEGARLGIMVDGRAVYHLDLTLGGQPVDPDHHEPRRAALRRLLADPGLTVLPGVYDALSATLVERSGFSGAYMSGAAVSMAVAGVPDLGLTTLTEMSAQAARIVSVLRVPLVADADTGFGNALNVQRTVVEYERAGVAGLHIEDQTYPKRCGHLTGKAVVATAEFVEKIRAAVEARTDRDLVLIARTDARGPLGFAEAIERANTYLAAGADLIFVEAPQTIDEIASIPREVEGPVMFNLVGGGRSPDVELGHLAECGYSLVILPVVLITSVVQAIIRTLASNGAPMPLDDTVQAPEDLFETVGLSGWLQTAQRFATD
jgi:2-methylisocitrate lyase-like PEP mutase family enzyme